MNYMVIYDLEGAIIQQGQGYFREPVGVPFMHIEVPEKKRVVSIDVSVTPNIPIFEDIPKTTEELNEERIAMAEEAINSLMMML